MSTLETYDVYEFGGFRLDPRRRVLARLDGEPIGLKPKALDTLVYLVEHAGEPLDKSTLLAAIWPNLVVEENNLNKTISMLRRVLGETPDDHHFIVTEPGRGYRFVAHVSRVPVSSAQASPVSAEALVPAAARGSFAYAVAGAIAATFALLLFDSYGLFELNDSAPPPATRFQIETTPTLNPLNMALSRDGRQIAYVGKAEFGTAIWVRSLGSVNARALAGTEGATETAYPFWSPDGRYVAFRTLRELKRVDVSSGEIVTVVDDITLFRRGAWGPDGTLLLATGEVIHRVPVTGGRSSPVTTLDSSVGEVVHSAPSFLPDGRHFLYKATNVNRRNGTIYVASLDPAERPKRLLEASRAIYVEPGFIVYSREQTLFARPFDAARLELTGEATQLADDVVYREILDTSAFDASDDGTLIYRREPERERGTPMPLLWVDRSGSARTVAGLAMTSADFELSPRGTRLAFAEGVSPDIWILDLVRGTRSRLTSEAEVDHNPVWSPDETFVAFDSHRNGGRELLVKRADGAVVERALLDAGAHDVRPTDWSADGKVIVFERDSCVGCAYDIWVLPVDGETEPFPYIESDFDERMAKLSPDGRWMAYMTSESGIYEVVVQSFPDPTRGKRQVSTNGGSAPRWARGGGELYYHDLTGSVVRVPIATAGELEVGEPVRVTAAPGASRWGVTADGEQLLIAAQDAERVLLPGPVAEHEVSTGNDTHFAIDVTLNWTSLLPGR